MLQVALNEQKLDDSHILTTVSRGVIIDGHLFVIYISGRSIGVITCQIIHLHTTNPDLRLQHVLWLNERIPDAAHWLEPDLNITKEQATLLAAEVVGLAEVFKNSFATPDPG